MDLLTRIEASLEFMNDGGPIRVDFVNLREVLEGSREALLKLEECQKELAGTKVIAEMRASRLGALQKAIEADLSDAKAVCGGDGEGCSAYRDYYDSAERRHRKCGTCPMDALFHVRAALNPLPTGDQSNGD